MTGESPNVCTLAALSSELALDAARITFRLDRECADRGSVYA